MTPEEARHLHREALVVASHNDILVAGVDHVGLGSVFGGGLLANAAQLRPYRLPYLASRYSTR